MTREEKISKAAYSQYCNSESICFTLMCDSFKQGAKWADEHPQSPWISVKDDLPCNHEELLDPSCEYNETVIVLTACGDGYFLNWMELERYGKWEWHSVKNVIHWMKLPELPKEEEIKL